MRIVSDSVGVHRGEQIRRWGWRGLGLGALVTFLSWSLMVPLDSFALFVTSLASGGLTVVSALAIGAAARRESARFPAAVEVTETEVVVHGPRPITLARADVVDGWVAHPHHVHLRARGGQTLIVATAGDAEAQALLERAGVGPAQRVLTVPLSSPASTTWGAAPLCVAGIALLSPAALFLAAVVSLGVQEMVTAPQAIGVFVTVLFLGLLATLLVAIFGLVTALRRREAVIGVDGVTVKSPLTRVFVPYADVVQVTPHAHGVELRRHQRPPVLLPTWKRGERPIHPQQLVYAEPAIRQRVLLDRIARAAGASRRAPAAEALDRGARTITAWRDHVVALGRRAGYRQEHFSPQDLAAVLEDPSAPRERRIAAALALAASDEPALTHRLRVAIDTCADDELRLALEHAAAEEHDELERTLRRLD